MKMKKGSVVMLSAKGIRNIETKDVFLYSRSYYTVEYFITYGLMTCVVFEEDKDECKYPVDWFDVVAQKSMEEAVVTEVDDIIAKQDFVPSEIHELCDFLSRWNGHVISTGGEQ